MLGLWQKAPWRHYVSAFRDSLNMWAVWLPGSHVEVGDYGLLENYCFQKKGSLKEFIKIDPKQIREKEVNISLQLGKFGRFQGGANADAQMPSIGSASVNLDVSASRGVFLRIDGLIEVEFVAPILVQRRLVQAIQERGLFWDKDWLLVSQVFSADSFAILATQERKSALKICGSVETLQSLNAGKAKAGANIEVLGATDLNIIGAKGPLALGLMKIAIDGFREGEYGLISDIGVRLSAIYPQDVRFPE